MDLVMLPICMAASTLYSLWVGMLPVAESADL